MKRPNSKSYKSNAQLNLFNETESLLTDEQQRAIDFSLLGETFTINAFAGTGKTFTAQKITEKKSGRGLYLAFNKEAANSAQKKMNPCGVEARTTHSMAWRYVASKMGNNKKKLTGDISPYVINKYLSLQDISLGEISLTGNELSIITHHAYNNFLNTESFKASQEHLPIWGVKIKTLTQNHIEKLENYIIDLCNYLWESAINSSNNDYPLSHSGYLKLWSLDGADNLSDYHYIILDEAQDTNQCVSWALTQHDYMQKIYIGDSYQQIYRWRGAVDAMATVNHENIHYLTKTFRFGKDIANYANNILMKLNSPKFIQPNSNIDSHVHESILYEKTIPDAILCRTNLGTFIKFLELLRIGVHSHIIEDSNDIKLILDDVIRLQLNKPAASYFLLGFQSWQHLKSYTKSNACDIPIELISLVTIVEQYGANFLIDSFKNMPSREDAITVITTVHKIKGDEWDNVELHTDFLPQIRLREGQLISTKVDSIEELMIYYVASTRAKKNLFLASKNEK